MRSQTSNRWNAGVNVGAGVFFQRSGALSIGGRIAYHRWAADGDGWAQDAASDYGPSYTYSLEATTGHQSVLEVVPSIQIALRRTRSPVAIAGQVGVGLFLVNQSQVTISGTFGSPSTSGHATLTYGSTSLTGYGIQLGLPVTIAGVVQLLPLYSLYFAGDAYHHFSVTAGVVLGR